MVKTVLTNENSLPERNQPEVGNGFIPDWLRSIFEKYKEGNDRDKPVSNFELLEDIRKLFPRDEYGMLQPCKQLEDLTDQVEGEEEEAIVQMDDDCRDMSLFVTKAKDLLTTRTSTLTGPLKRGFPKKFQNEYYKEFKKYLKLHGFKEKMVEVIYNMFTLHPNLPENPLQYIRDNYGVTLEEETATVKKWLKLKSSIQALKKENGELKARLHSVLEGRQPVGRWKTNRADDSTGGDAKRMSSVTYSLLDYRKKKQKPSSVPSHRGTSVQVKREMSGLKTVDAWNYNAGQEYMAQDSKVPFEPPEYDLPENWVTRRYPQELVMAESSENQGPEDEEEQVETSSDSDYSVQSLQKQIL